MDIPRLLPLLPQIPLVLFNPELLVTRHVHVVLEQSLGDVPPQPPTLPFSLLRDRQALLLDDGDAVDVHEHLLLLALEFSVHDIVPFAGEFAEGLALGNVADRAGYVVPAAAVERFTEELYFCVEAGLRAADRALAAELDPRPGQDAAPVSVREGDVVLFAVVQEVDTRVPDHVDPDTETQELGLCPDARIDLYVVVWMLYVERGDWRVVGDLLRTEHQTTGSLRPGARAILNYSRLLVSFRHARHVEIALKGFPEHGVVRLLSDAAAASSMERG